MQVQRQEGAHYDQPANNFAHAWCFWSVRDERELFDYACYRMPPLQLVHVLFLIRKMVRHPEWRQAARYRPADEDLQAFRELIRQRSVKEPRRALPFAHFAADLLANAARYAGLEREASDKQSTRP